MEDNTWPVCRLVCEKCQYFFGLSGGDFRNGATNSGKALPMCSYYLDTGKHRCDDFGRKKDEDEWMVCNKFEPRWKKREGTKPGPISKKGIAINEAHRRYGEV